MNIMSPTYTYTICMFPPPTSWHRGQKRSLQKAPILSSTRVFQIFPPPIGYASTLSEPPSFHLFISNITSLIPPDSTESLFLEAQWATTFVRDSGLVPHTPAPHSIYIMRRTPRKKGSSYHRSSIYPFKISPLGPVRAERQTEREKERMLRSSGRGIYTLERSSSITRKCSITV